jgi:hypothetical protein
MNKILLKLKTLPNQGQTFQQLNTNNDIIDASKETVTEALWSDGQATLTGYFTSSALTTAQQEYYVNVSQKAPSDTGSAVQFALAFGDNRGSGSLNNGGGTAGDSPSRAIYSQYKQLLLSETEDVFSFQTGSSTYTTPSVYIINIQRARSKERLDPGNWELPLVGIHSRENSATGSVILGGPSGSVVLIDDSSTEVASSTTEIANSYNIVSGSLTDGIYKRNTTETQYYGKVYPQHSVLVLDAEKLDRQLKFQTNTGSNSQGNNHYALFHSISGSVAANSGSFQARNKETISSTMYFIRLNNADFNYSNNPSYVTGSDFQIANTGYWTDPVSYITTVGLYNANQELLAVAKLSQPIKKDKKSELNIRIKLDY